MIEGLIDIPNEEYHAIEDSYSSSDLKAIYKGSVKEWKHEKGQPKESEAMAFGSAFHHYVLENDTFFDNYIVEPEFEPTEIDKKTGELKVKGRGWKNTTDYKNQKAEFAEKAKGLTVVSEFNFYKIRAMHKSIMESEAKNYIFPDDAQYEKVAFGELGSSGIKARIKMDVASKKLRAIVDLKSCADVSEDGFGKAVWNFSYDLQAEFYKAVLKNFTGEEYDFIFVAVKSEAPYSACVYKLSDKRKEHGTNKIVKAIDKIKLSEKGLYGYKAESELVEI
jgi:hypothetical protein